ncbi:tumor necrosis factor ligand superfamily member 18 [Paralichthys olivaceus]|uniref:tumor necrosis factor ligand superfamily member 18 n=1 Tax=Paralichthys olivaceus TaxID=8255 RepID=UPI003750BEEF
MSQRSQHCLVHVLLLWTAVLSIMQVLFFIFYFTVGRQHNIAGAPTNTMQIQSNNTPSFSTEHGLLLGKGKMLTFQASDDKTGATWLAKNPDSSRVLVGKGNTLIVKKDGYYFLNLQVTLCSCEEEHTVSLKWDGKPLLQGSINTKPCSTGIMAKVEELYAGGALEVTIKPNISDIESNVNICINTTESVTHLDIIYMLKP